MNKNIEATILSSFLDVDSYEDDPQLFNLDPEVFSNDCYKYVAKQINRFVELGKPMGLLWDKLDVALAGTAYEFDYLFMLGRMHVDTRKLKHYYDDLVYSHKKALLKGAIA